MRQRKVLPEAKARRKQAGADVPAGPQKHEFPRAEVSWSHPDQQNCLAHSIYSKETFKN